MSEQTSINTMLLGLIGVILAAFLAYFVRLNKTVTDQAKELAILKTQISPLWAQVQARIAADLHHPHPRYFEMDGLLEKLEALTITHEERDRLKALLLERSLDQHPDITDDQRNKATFMISVMDLVLIEAKEMKDDAIKDEGLQELAKQTLRNADKTKVAAEIMVEQAEKQIKDKEKI